MEEKEFITYLEENPALFGVAKSGLCINLLRTLSEQGLPIIELKKDDFFSKYNENDLQTVLDMLVSLNLLDKTGIGIKKVYFANKNTKQFLQNYDAVKKHYNL